MTRKPKQGTFERQRRSWARRKVHPYNKIERPDILRLHLVEHHGQTEDGIFRMPDRHHECYALHQTLHREMGGGWLVP